MDWNTGPTNAPVEDKDKMSNYEEKRKTALWLEDLKTVVGAMTAIDDALETRVIYDAKFTVVRDDGDDLAEIWFDSESESWVCNWLRGSGL